MKVKEFVEMYNNNSRINIEKELEVMKYISIASKREMARLILDNCAYVVDGEIHVDSVERYILFTITAISLHTNLEFAHEDDGEYSAIDDYDLLCESGLLVKIIDTFKDDYLACQEILNMMTSDMLQNNMTIEKKIAQFLDTIESILAVSADNIVDGLESKFEALNFGQDELRKLYDLIERK